LAGVLISFILIVALVYNFAGKGAGEHGLVQRLDALGGSCLRTVLDNNEPTKTMAS
jgi:hypothetical protein